MAGPAPQASTPLLLSTASEPLCPGDDGRPVRMRLLDLIQAEPGINKSDACGRLDVAWGTVSYHVARLARDGLAETHQRGREVLLFPRGTGAGLRLSAAALREEAAAEVLRVLAARRQASLHELSKAIALSRKVARRLVRSLLEAGLVENTSRGRPRYVLATARHQPPMAGLGTPMPARQPLGPLPLQPVAYA